jgi:hypothetical protein
VNLDDLLQGEIDAHVKGVPPAAAPVRLIDIGRRGWNLLRGDLPLPVAVIKRAALDHNSGWMRRFLELTGSRIAPHGKTTMAPQLFARQLADGAWGITVATVGQMMVCRAFGVERVLLANQLIGRQEIATVLAELRRDPGSISTAWSTPWPARLAWPAQRAPSRSAGRSRSCSRADLPAAGPAAAPRTRPWRSDARWPRRRRCWRSAASRASRAC